MSKNSLTNPLNPTMNRQIVLAYMRNLVIRCCGVESDEKMWPIGIKAAQIVLEYSPKEEETHSEEEFGEIPEWARGEASQ